MNGTNPAPTATSISVARFAGTDAPTEIRGTTRPSTTAALTYTSCTIPARNRLRRVNAAARRRGRLLSPDADAKTGRSTWASDRSESATFDATSSGSP